MKRTIQDSLVAWAKASKRKPLLIRGARQIGKTFVVRQLAERFENFVEVNFELSPHYQQCFSNLDPNYIINMIQLLSKQSIQPGKTLLFFDEIQNCPEALQALRYFKEKLPELHVLAAGSLLEFTLYQENISMPVGRIEYLYMYPCTFQEYLLNTGEHRLVDFLADVTLHETIPTVIHDKLLSLFRAYMAVGGMPEVMSAFIDTPDYHTVQRLQNSILRTYHDDFGKYANLSQHKYLQSVFEKAPGLVGTQVQYTKIAPEYRSRELKQAINLLEYAGILKRIYASTASGLPLSATQNDKKFKFSFLDVGLVQRVSGLETALLQAPDLIKLNDGQLAEQVVAQEIMAYQDPFSPSRVYFWARDKRGAQAEIDYVVNVKSMILPIEVKSGATGKLKSLRLFMQEKSSPVGVKISTAPLGLEKNILSLPIYLIWKLPELIEALV